MTTDDPLGSTFIYFFSYSNFKRYRLLPIADWKRTYGGLHFACVQFFEIAWYSTICNRMVCFFHTQCTYAIRDYTYIYVCIFSLLASCCAASVIIPHIYTDKIAKILKFVIRRQHSPIIYHMHKPNRYFCVVYICILYKIQKKRYILCCIPFHESVRVSRNILSVYFSALCCWCCLVFKLPAPR